MDLKGERVSPVRKEEQTNERTTDECQYVKKIRICHCVVTGLRTKLPHILVFDFIMESQHICLKIMKRTIVCSIVHTLIELPRSE